MAPNRRSTRAPPSSSVRTPSKATATAVANRGTLRGFGGRVTKSGALSEGKNEAKQKILDEDDEIAVVVTSLTGLGVKRGKETDEEGAEEIVKEEGTTVIGKATISEGNGKGRKRRRDDADDEEELLSQAALIDADKKGRPGLKRAKLDIRNSVHPLPTPPRSSPGSPSRSLGSNSTGDVPSPPSRSTTSITLELQTLQTLHTLLLRNLSLHFAHHRSDVTVPANLHEVTQGMTKMWKVRRVTVEDVRRVLGVYECENDGNSNDGEFEGCRVAKRTTRCPFRLVSTLSANLGGGGTGEVLRLEFVGQETGTERAMHKFEEQALSAAYARKCVAIVEETKGTDQSKVLIIPMLEIEIGRQTQRKMEIGRKLRQSVLGGFAKEPKTEKEVLTTQKRLKMGLLSDDTATTIIDEPQIDAPPPASTTMTIPPSIKSRTSALFDRVKSRSSLSASNSLLSATSSTDVTTKPMSKAEQILHAHALGRVGDVVNILRMKQQQKMNGRGEGYGEDGSGSARVSFSLEQIIREVQASLGVPMAREEVVRCVEILDGMTDRMVIRKVSETGDDVHAGRVEGQGWLRLVTMGKVRSVVLSGMGWSGRDVGRMLISRSS